jgi:uncharacterized membrane protein YheB (UPF0754 family)
MKKLRFHRRVLRKEEEMGGAIFEIIPYLAIPVVSGLVGWGTNALAIQMMFFPVFRRGLGILGWQGIIPGQAEKMASICVDLMLERLLDPAELYARLEPSKVARLMQPELDARLDPIVDRVVAEHFPGLWRRVPRGLRQRARDRIRRELPGVVEGLMTDVHQELETYLDLRRMVIDAFLADPALLNQLFLRCGEREFRFISRSGLLFGALFGIPLAIASAFFSPWITLGLGGLLVGWATNWLALKMVFHPNEPRGVGPFVWQGLFLRRQREVSHAYASHFAEHILFPRALFEAVLEGQAADALYATVLKHLADAVDLSLGRGKTALEWAAGARRYETMKEGVAADLFKTLPAAMTQLEDYADQTLAVGESLRENLEMLPPQQFSGVLRPIFSQDEGKLIAVGAALGMMAGTFQAFFVF